MNELFNTSRGGVYKKCLLLSVYEKLGLVLRPVQLKKCIDISNSTETQGVHLVGQGGTS